MPNNLIFRTELLREDGLTVNLENNDESLTRP